MYHGMSAAHVKNKELPAFQNSNRLCMRKGVQCLSLMEKEIKRQLFREDSYVEHYKLKGTGYPFSDTSCVNISSVNVCVCLNFACVVRNTCLHKIHGEYSFFFFLR